MAIKIKDPFFRDIAEACLADPFSNINGYCGYRVMTTEDVDPYDTFEGLASTISKGASLSKIVSNFSKFLPYSCECSIQDLSIQDLFDSRAVVVDLINAKENYFASRGIPGKIRALFSRVFGSIKDAKHLKNQIEKLINAETNAQFFKHLRMRNVQALEICKTFTSAHTEFCNKQRISPSTEDDAKKIGLEIQKLYEKMEDCFTKLTLFNKEVAGLYSDTLKEWNRILANAF